ncbi:MAG: Na/Pi cotransporter family protein [Eubacteriales bacterium]|nr:Na/Pi cotransporter family protein [Eubacteriales bacterium]
MDIFDLLSMVGGLALFLYGMHIMGDGLSKASGGKLEKILEKLTSNPIKAVLLGAGVTAVIQSSSATTVMVVGFVNSGIMKLHQAVGIIMGANIGTTATSWILSLTGIESNNFWIRMLKPSSFSPILALAGVVFIMFMKKEKKHDIGLIMIGFAILMTGMDAMSAAVKPLADVPEFTNILTMFSNPVLGMVAGLVLTAIIQSSSASVGILQALCATGSLAYATAFPIIMGQNIGTCVTAMISSVGASKNAKRAALVHLYFNIIGTIIFMAVFYLINTFVPFAFLSDSANAMGIAVIHTVFNVTATLLLLPFGRLLEKLACMTVRDTKEENMEVPDEFALLDERFLDKPSLAMQHCKEVTNNMAELSKKSLFTALDLVGNFSENAATRVSSMEDRVDRYEDVLGTYLMKLSSRDLSEKDSEELSMLLHTIGNFERISDHACNITETAREMYDKEMAFSEKARMEMQIFTEAVKEIVTKTFTSFEEENIELAKTVEPLEEVIDDLNMELKSRHVRRLTEGKCTIELGFVHSDLLTNYERVSDHCSNIAVCLIQTKLEGFDTHEYLDTIKREDNEQFKSRYAEYKEKYQLPVSSRKAGTVRA